MSIWKKLITRIYPGWEQCPGWKKYEPLLQVVNERRRELSKLPDEELRRTAPPGTGPAGDSLTEWFALAAVACERVLGLRPFDVQIIGALAMADGKIVEMQTGEGKTLAATMAVSALARGHSGFHVMTANDYLARRDAEWMRGVYEFLGLSVGYLSQRLTGSERRRAYCCDITYATANEIGFDYLRDGLVLRAEDAVQRKFHAALIDEADSILIDEARIPLVIAGGDEPPHEIAVRVAAAVRDLKQERDYALDEHGRNVYLTEAGYRQAETALRCADLFQPANAQLLTALQNALHALVLLRRDVDYVVKNGRIELVDEFKGRIADNRRWPAGLQTALEAKEGLDLQKQGRVLGSITLHNLISLYPRVCGMTGTAATQAAEFKEFYGLEVVAIPTNKPVIRTDHPDRVFRTRAKKEDAVVREIGALHASGRPILVGTASVEESERLSERLLREGITHEVLNARDEEREARIISRAGCLGAVTISTNMAGRGTDIPLGGEDVRDLGGLHVIGTNRHESRRIDHQLRGRAGRQGDPGSSRFFISLEDELLLRYGLSDLIRQQNQPYAKGPAADPAAPAGMPFGEAINTVQRIVEEENLMIRTMLTKYEHLVEQQRRLFRTRRDARMMQQATASELTRMDEGWAEHLAAITELRDGLCWISLGGQDPFPRFFSDACRLFDSLLQSIEARAGESGPEDSPAGSGATWTYVINDHPFGNLTDRLYAGLQRRVREALEKVS